MRNGQGTGKRPHEPAPKGLALPTAQFRRKAWLAFQRALDPLGPPKRLRLPPR